MDDDLTAFVTARLDEDEAAAKATAEPRRWHPDHFEEASEADQVHIARHDPWRVLSEVEADHRLLAEWQKAEADPAVDDQWNAGFAAGLRLAVRIRAARHSDHSHYRAEWENDG